MTADAAAVRRRPKDRKQQILVQARDLFLGLGYPNVSMAMIADRVGITAGALYRHYSTKADLLEAVVRDVFRTVTPPAEGMALDEPSSPWLPARPSIWTSSATSASRRSPATRRRAAWRSSSGCPCPGRARSSSGLCGRSISELGPAGPGWPGMAGGDPEAEAGQR
jgi:AcrR family transcriptional regulator